MTKVSKFSLTYFKLYNLKNKYKQKANKVEKEQKKSKGTNLESYSLGEK